MRLRSFLALSRRSFALRPGRVLRRTLSRRRACRSRSANRARASSRLARWLRCWPACRSRTPWRLIRPASRCRIRAFCSSLRPDDAWMSNRSVTLVLTLFTCWPPLPELREKENEISERGMRTAGVMVHHCRWFMMVWLLFVLYLVPLRGVTRLAVEPALFIIIVAGGNRSVFRPPASGC